MLIILQYLNTLSPLGLAGLLALVLWRMASWKQVANVSDNHLHEVVDALRRVEVAQAAGFAAILARLNHKPQPQP